MMAYSQKLLWESYNCMSVIVSTYLEDKKQGLSLCVSTDAGQRAHLQNSEFLRNTAPVRFFFSFHL